MILSNYFVHSFFVAVIIIFYFLIAYFNYNAFKTALENKKVFVYQQPDNCNYTNLEVIPDNNKCTKLNLYYITIDKLTYTLSTDDSNSTSICKILCNSYDDTATKPCQGNELQINQYNQCIQDLEPSSSCKGLAKPLGYRFNKITNQKTNLYAKQVIDINNCI